MAIVLQSLARKRSFVERRASNAKPEWNRSDLIAYVRKDCSAVIITRLLHFIIFQSIFSSKWGSHNHTPCSTMCLCLFSPSNFWICGAVCTKFEREQQFQRQLRSFGCHENRCCYPCWWKGCNQTSSRVSHGRVHMGKDVTSTPNPGKCSPGVCPFLATRKSNYRVQNCKKTAFISPTAEGTTHLKFNFSEPVL